jgi:pyruvate,water dikinase
MDPASALVVPLRGARALGNERVGGKAAKLSDLIALDYPVPRGFCIATDAYRRFVEKSALNDLIASELGRKPLSSMRWEEIWDSALRIRAAFLKAPVPSGLAREIVAACRALTEERLVVRSSAPEEDSAQRSYAGLHESVLGVTGEEALLDAVRVVWASLWSDAALLYRRELSLNVRTSAMAVIVQELVATDRSGVAFGIDPRAPAQDRQVIEAVPGLCRDLVDGAVDPDRWLVERSSGEIIDWHPGKRSQHSADPLLDGEDLGRIHRTLNSIEERFGWAADLEWTGRGSDFTLLQARPVTMGPVPDADDQRDWYLSLRPGTAKLRKLCDRVVDDLIPRLEADGRRLAAEAIEGLTDEELARAIDSRAAAFSKWKRIYWDEFIPFAHGVRQLGTYYNDAVKPEDPYEFTGILAHQPMIAAARNGALRRAAVWLKNHPALLDALHASPRFQSDSPDEAWRSLKQELRRIDGGRQFVAELDRVRERYMDVVHDGIQLDTRPDLLLHAVMQLSDREPTCLDRPSGIDTPARKDCERHLLEAVGLDRREEARSVIEIARLSWKLRDDDNVLLGRIEHQLLRAATLAAERLGRSGRLKPGARVTADSASALSAALRDSEGGSVDLQGGADNSVRPIPPRAAGEKPRQIVGQPAAPGLAIGCARKVRTTADLMRFRAGEVLICDAIQPTMSHIVPLAAAIAERRGGMLIHGAIIARELGIPCVNGVSDAILGTDDGEIVTVDGHLGIVTIGAPEFDLEAQAHTA